MSNERVEIGTKLKEAREYLGLSQQEVSESLKLPRSAISLIESGQRRVDSLEMKEFARLYQRPVSYFTSDEQPSVPKNVELIARKASKLSDRDRQEVLQFTEFLLTRTKREKT